MIVIKETQVKAAILSYLSWKPLEFFVWPNDSVGIWDKKKGIYRKSNSRFHINGVSDILGIWNSKVLGTKPLAIEVKTIKGKVSSHQTLFIEKFNKYGGVALLARSVDDLIVKLKNIESEFQGRATL